MGDYAAPWHLRMLSFVAPKRAAVLTHFDRLSRDEDYQNAVGFALRARGYKAAKTGAGITPWIGANTQRSADGEVLFDLPKLRARSRMAHRDDPIAAGLLRNFVNDVVGTGIRFHSDDDSLELAWAEIKDTLAPADGCDFWELQRLLYMKLLEDGEVLVKRSMDHVGMFFEVIEADRLATPLDAQPKDEQSQIREGVERDRTGRVVAYWLAKFHPGDTYLPHLKGRFPRPVFTAADFNRVPADACYHLKLATRPGQSRGVPFLTPCLQDLRDLDLLMEAALKRSQVAACLAAFITSEETVPDLLQATAEDYGYVLDDPIQPGMMMKLFPGEKVTTMPASEFGADFEQFVILLARRIGAALGVSWQLVLKDFSSANYSSARTDQLEARKVFRAHQQKLIGCLRWIFGEAMGFAQISGQVRGDIRRQQWVTPGWEWVDPAKEVAAAEQELAIGLTTLRDLAASRGRDWQDLARQSVIEESFVAELRKAAGLDEKPEQDEAEEQEQGDDTERALPGRAPAVPAFRAEVRRFEGELNMRRLEDKLDRIAEKAQDDREPKLEIHAHVEVPKEAVVEMRAPDVIVNVPKQPTPVVNVAPPVVNVAAQRAPVVNVAPPAVSVAQPQITVEAPNVTVEVNPELAIPARRIKVERDRDGKITEAVASDLPED